MPFEIEIEEMFSDEYAELAVFTPDPAVPGTTESVYVVVEHDAELRPENIDIGIVEIGTTITFSFLDIGEPDHGSLFAVSGKTYRVARTDSNDEIVVKVVVNEVT